MLRQLPASFQQDILVEIQVREGEIMNLRSAMIASEDYDIIAGHD